MRVAGSFFERIRSWHLVLILAAVYGLLGIYKIIPLRPQSIHQWAQCDRASVAWNYYMGYADFFHPRVNNTDNGTGITGLEFPVVQYFVSILYRLFGFHEWLYRLTTLLVFTLGTVSVFRLAAHFLRDKLSSLLIMLLYVCSPLLAFYACSFVPDIYSLSFAMIAWALLVRYVERPAGFLIGRWFAALLIACLIKPNSMIHLPVMWMFLWFNDHWSWKKPFRFMGYFVTIAGLTLAWYFYASWLSKSVQSEVFLLEMRPPRSWQEVKDVWEIVSKDWLNRIYHPVLLVFIVGSGIVAAVVSNPLKEQISALTVFMLLGVSAFLSLMLLQLSYHDYYFITMFPVLIFLLILSGITLRKKFKERGQFLFVLLLTVSTGFQFYFAKTHIRTSHKKDNWKYGGVYNDKYFDPSGILKAGGIRNSDQVILVFDHSPNIGLYLLGVRGVSIPYRNLPETMMGYLHTGRYQYVLYNKESRITDLNFNPADFPLDSLTEVNGIQIFKVSSSFLPDRRTAPLSPWN